MDTEQPLDNRTNKDLKKESIIRSLNPELEKSIIKALSDENLITQKNFLFNKTHFWTYAALSLVAIFSIGYFFGTNDISNPLKPNYLLVLYEDENFVPPQDVNLSIEYYDWLVSISEKGVDISGNELTMDRFSLQSPLPQTFVEQTLSGYFLFRASSSIEAIEIANSSPHTKYGGLIELREINQH